MASLPKRRLWQNMVSLIQRNVMLKTVCVAEDSRLNSSGEESHTHTHTQTHSDFNIKETLLAIRAIQEYIW